MYSQENQSYQISVCKNSTRLSDEVKYSNTLTQVYEHRHMLHEWLYERPLIRLSILSLKKAPILISCLLIKCLADATFHNTVKGKNHPGLSLYKVQKCPYNIPGKGPVFFVSSLWNKLYNCVSIMYAIRNYFYLQIMYHVPFSPTRKAKII